MAKKQFANAFLLRSLDANQNALTNKDKILFIIPGTTTSGNALSADVSGILEEGATVHWAFFRPDTVSSGALPMDNDDTFASASVLALIVADANDVKMD